MSGLSLEDTFYREFGKSLCTYKKCWKWSWCVVDPCIIVQFLQWKIQQVATVYQNFIIPYFKWSSTCFGRHTAHHQEPKTAQAASGFAYVEGCWTCSCWTLSGSVRYLTTSNNWPARPRPTTLLPPRSKVKPEAANAVISSWWWAWRRPKHVEQHINIK